EGLPIDVIGMNCSTGPEHMREPLRFLGEQSSLPVSCIPNAGLPLNIDGRAVYPLEPQPFAEALVEYVEKYNVNIVGGCCGTGLSKFAAIGISYANFWDKFPDYRLMMHTTGFIKPPMESGPRGMEFHEVSLKIIKTMTGAIEQGIRDGSIRKEVDPMTAAFCISSSLQGVLQNLDSREAELNAMGLPRKKMIFETLELFGRALADPDQDCGSVLGKMRKERGGKRK
ncbi:MAG: hypothetical protein HGB17_19110, partial [Syntrophobacteraceae bacterium]|nr:hypothetical protein [Syntrophobacteraceae bacterium]